MNIETKAGYVAIVGQPNVGKSTLLNYLLGKKLSITSRKPQTTRHRVLGIKTRDHVQIIYVDTPGLHQAAKHAMNRYMNRVARSALSDVDVILFVIDAKHFNEQDVRILELLKKANAPVILVLNKIDLVKDRSVLLPLIEDISKRYAFAQVVPVSAKLGKHLDDLEQTIIALLPEDVHFYPPGQLTDRSEQFITTEIVREKLMRNLGQELPYELTVTLDQFRHEGNLLRIAALIWVEKPSQKAIVIGEDGQRLKTIATKARVDLERHFNKKVFLQCWVKVKSGWSDDERSLQQFGYDE